VPKPKPVRSRRRAKPQPRGDAGLLDRLRDHLDRLGLKELDANIDAHFAWAHEHNPAALVLLERVFGEAAGHVRQRRVERRIDLCGLRVRKTLEAFDWAFQKNLNRPLVENLATLAFVDNRDDLLITGKSGTGKSHILQALALRACEREIRVAYTRCVDLVDDLYAGLADQTYERRLRKWARAEWLVIDDVGLGQLRRRDDEPTAAHMLFNLLDSRHEQAPTALTSNIKLGEWGKYLGDATLAAAILDRLAATSIRIDIDGPSYRDYLAKRRAKDHGIVDDAA
jgi:DNA replication protein DnaC